LHKELNPEEEIFVRFDDAGTGQNAKVFLDFWQKERIMIIRKGQLRS
jgi:hypothetical protein